MTLDIRAWGWRAALVALVAALLLPGLLIGPSLDATIFSAVGWRLSAGDALYAQVWEQKPPGVFLPYAFAHLLTDDPATAWGIVWTITVACIGGAALIVRRILVDHGVHPLSAGVAASLAAASAAAYLLSLGGGMSESFAILPIAAAALLASRGRWSWCGLLAGIAIIISFQSISLLVAVTALGVTANPGTTLRRAGLVAVGMTAAVAVVALGLWITGGIGEALDALIGYNSAYVAVARRLGGAAAFALLPWSVLVLLPLIIGLGLAVIHRHRLASSRLALAAAAWIVVQILLIGIQGRFYAHYATLLVAPMAILAGLGIDAAHRTLPRRAAALLLGVPLAAGLVISLVVGAAGARDERAPVQASNQRAEVVAAEIRGRTAEDDTILVWGNDARVYELADRRPAIRFVYLYPLLTRDYVTEVRIADLVAELEQAPPAVVVDTGSLGPGEPGLPPLLIDRPIATDGRDEDLLDPLRALVARDYRLVGVIEGWPLYERSAD